jgi:hypothetical protein
VVICDANLVFTRALRSVEVTARVNAGTISETAVAVQSQFRFSAVSHGCGASSAGITLK